MAQQLQWNAQWKQADETDTADSKDRLPLKRQLAVRDKILRSRANGNGRLHSEEPRPLEPAPIGERPRTRKTTPRPPGPKRRARTETTPPRAVRLWRGFAGVSRWVIASGVWAKLTGTAKGVLVVLAYRANTENEAWPSVGTMAKEMGGTRGRVREALRDLLTLGVIHQIGRAPKGRTNRYRILRNRPSANGSKTDPSRAQQMGPKRTH